jgi:predicted anti-sigma-YlaC factor YlaD
MNCTDIRNLLPVYLDGELEASEQRRVKTHLDGCEACRREVDIIAKSWEMLGELGGIEPNPFYVSRFFARVGERRPRHAKWVDLLRSVLSHRRLLPVMAAAGLVILIGIGVTHMQQRTDADARLAAVQLNGLDVELFESIEIADNFELIKELELLSDMEIIQELEWIEAS